MSEDKKDQVRENVCEDFLLPKKYSRAVASFWRSLLKEMKENGEYPGSIPDFFMARCNNNGGLSLDIVSFPEGVVVVGDQDEEGDYVLTKKAVVSVPQVEEEVPTVAVNKKDTGRRTLILEEGQGVKVK